MTAVRGVKIEKMNSDMFNFTREQYYETGAASRWWKKLTFVIPTGAQVADIAFNAMASESGSERNFKRCVYGHMVSCSFVNINLLSARA
jgi:hypothetical protein